MKYKKYLKFTKLEKDVIRGFVEIVTTNNYQYPYDEKTFESDLHSAISYWKVSAEQLSKSSEIPTKKLRGVLSSLVKKNVLYEDIDQDEFVDIIVFGFHDYFWAEDCTDCQVDDCDMDKIYDAIS